MGAYTRLGACLWDWDPFVKLDHTARILWLALYTSPEAKRLVPGLWHGSIGAMADAAKMAVSDATKALDTLLDHELVEFDQKNRVLRLVVLPDGGESPANGNVIVGWYKRFKNVPACAVRDAHVATLRWIMDEWQRENDGKEISKGHNQAWDETFGKVAVPTPRKRGVRRLADSATGTDLQPGLFDPPSPPSRASDSDTENGSGDDEADSADHPVDNSDTLRKPKDLSVRETVTDTVSKRYSIPSGLGSGSRSGSRSSLPEDPAPPPAEISTSTRPHLALVPAVQPPRELLAFIQTLAGTTRVDVHQNVQDALCGVLADLEARDMGDPVSLALAAAWLQNDRPLLLEIYQIGGDPLFRLSLWAAIPGNVASVIEAAREHERVSNAKSEALAVAKASLGFQP